MTKETKPLNFPAAILQAGINHMQDRADTYDKPEGERSMLPTVRAFEAVTGIELTEEQGWLFMILLKCVRSQQGNYKQDNYEDGSAFFGLCAEAAWETRKGGKFKIPESFLEFSKKKHLEESDEVIQKELSSYENRAEKERELKSALAKKENSPDSLMGHQPVICVDCDKVIEGRIYYLGNEPKCKACANEV